jgi:hypothetical protein
MLGGKMHNDAQVPGESRPLVTVTNQMNAITFDGKSRMISSFNIPNPAEGTVELWAFPEAAVEQRILLQWGAWSVPSKLLPAGQWSHVAVTFTKEGAIAHVNGQKKVSSVSTDFPGTRVDRLIVGGAWTGRGWSNGFRGHLAGLRIYQDVLTPEQIRASIVASDCMRPALPMPDADSEVVASRKPVLAWQVGAGASDTRADLYLGTQASVVAVADRASPAYQGIKKSGECCPLLKSGTRYYWRVDRLTSAGKPSVHSEVWSFKTAEEVVLDLDAATLSSGPVTKWANKGVAGGVFSLEEGTSKPPQAELVDGRKAVTFDGQASVSKSSIFTPTSLTGDHPLTVEMWVKNPAMAECETILGLAPSVAMKGFDKERMNCAANFSFGSGHEKNRDLRPGFFTCGMHGCNVGWKEEGFLKTAPQWTHVAHVFTGGYRGNFKVYVNGTVVNDKGFMTLNTVGGYPMFLGASWNTALGASNKFTGSLARLKVYDYVRTEADILAAAHEK